ncbi:MAG: ribosome maturation factor RimP [bacterium]
MDRFAAIAMRKDSIDRATEKNSRGDRMDHAGLDDQCWGTIQKMIREDVRNEGFELVDVQLNRAKGRFLLRIFMDHEKGVDLNDCERVSRRISDSLDTVDLIPGSYVLEISSPGLDRPLKREEDFIRYCGQRVRLTFGAPQEKIQSVEGRILGIEEHTLHIEDMNGERREIPFPSIIKARLVVDF